MNKKRIYLKAIVICHGKSEVQMCKYIKQNLRLPLEIISEKNGAQSIQITSIMNTLNNKIFTKEASFKKHFATLEIIQKKLTDDFKIFIIMDTDDCTDRQCEDFKNKTMFKSHWLHDYILPIHNTPHLEKILEKSGIKFTKKSNREKKTEYVTIFPTDKNHKTNDFEQIKAFSKNIKKCKNTNMSDFIDFCLQIAEENKLR